MENGKETSSIDIKRVLDEIDAALAHPTASLYAQGFIQPDPENTQQTMSIAYKASKRFVLDTEKVERFYSESEGTVPEHLFQMAEPDFRLPFDYCLFAFSKPIEIMWMSKEGKGYSNQKLMGVLAQEWFVNQKEIIKTPEGYDQRRYRFFLLFKENPFDEMIKDISKYQEGKEDPVFISYQFADLGVVKYPDKPGIHLYFLNHYPCQDKKICQYTSTGQFDRSVNIVGKICICNEVMVRGALFRMLIEAINKINEVMIIDKTPERKKNFWGDLTNKFLPSKPWGWPFTRGNIPRDNYIQYLGDTRYRYNKEDLNLGSGSHHRYRYDVRRHPRIVDGEIIWVSPHQRGSGTYHPKIYASKGKWYIHYAYWALEKLTSIRVINILLAKAIVWFREKFGISK